MPTANKPATHAGHRALSWHAYDSAAVLDSLESREAGLSANEAATRQKRYGPNQFTQERMPSLIERLLGQFKNPLVFVLLIATGVTLALGELVDSGVIALALFIAIAVGIVQEGKASRAFQKLAQSQVHVAYVVRDGAKSELSSAKLVPGDIVELQSGMQVPADVRLLKATRLAINEAPLTGEWRAVEKKTGELAVGIPLTEQTNMAFMGTFVAEGRARAVVVATGDHTAVGALAQSVQHITDEKTPLQEEMAKVSKTMLYIILALVSAIFVIGIWQDQPLTDMLFMAVAIAVASIPEGLPAAVTIILAVGMEALLKRGGLVRNLLAAETLGSTTYVLTDKTGTLTEGTMAITSVLVQGEPHTDASTWKQHPVITALFNTALGASDAFYDQAADVVRGDPVEQAMLKTAQELELVDTEHAYHTERIDYLPFTSEQLFAAGTSPDGERTRLCINGAPSALLAAATHQETKDGPTPLDKAKRAHLTAAIENETAAGKRLVAVGYKYVSDANLPDDGSGVLAEITFLGVIVFNDPVRDGISEAINGVKAAGAKILLITGDNPDTARSIAYTAGIAPADARVIIGSELQEYTDEAIEDLIAENVRVFARILPQQKLRIAQILQRKGEIVAMTGDGINDAPALRKANIGVATGSGTEVAKESSDLVLVNDSFATIYAAIEEGRRVISNLRKIVGYLLSTSLSEVVLIGAALLVGAPAPITAAQILWANVIEEGLMSVAFAFEPGEKGAMQRKPHDIHEEGILSASMLWFMAFAISVLSILTLSLYFYLRSVDIPFAELRSAMFLSIAMDSLFMAFAFRSLTTPVWKVPLRTNLFFVGSFVISAGFLVAALSVPFLRDVLDYTPLPFYDILLVFGFSVASLLTIELGKLLFFEQRDEVVE